MSACQIGLDRIIGFMMDNHQVQGSGHLCVCVLTAGRGAEALLYQT